LKACGPEFYYVADQIFIGNEIKRKKKDMVAEWVDERSEKTNKTNDKKGFAFRGMYLSI
jgi:hypothetical protein